jgi:gluconokinase
MVLKGSYDSCAHGGNRVWQDHNRQTAGCGDGLAFCRRRRLPFRSQQGKDACIPLTDEDRKPWLATLHQLLLGWYESGISGILGCSALKQSYRDELTPQIPSVNIRFILLEVSRPVLEQRLRERKNHYMSPELLQSQLDTLEVTPDLMRVNAEGPPEKIVAEILDELLTVEGKIDV